MDWSRIETLRDEIGAEDLPEVVGLFLDEAQETVARIAGGAEGRGLAADLHALKGTALNLGLTELAQLCLRGEAAVAAGQAGAIDRRAIAERFAASAAALRRHLAAGAEPPAA